MNAHDILKAARAKIERPECWTQDVFARDTKGDRVHALSPNAVCWCSIGACVAVASANPPNDLSYRIALDALAGVTGVAEISDFNDTHTHAEVLAAFDKAIEATAP